MVALRSEVLSILGSSRPTTSPLHRYGTGTLHIQQLEIKETGLVLRREIHQIEQSTRSLPADKPTAPLQPDNPSTSPNRHTASSHKPSPDSPPDSSPAGSSPLDSSPKNSSPRCSPPPEPPPPQPSADSIHSLRLSYYEQFSQERLLSV